MLNFTLKQLRYVEAAGRLGSISAAANELNISQSSITAAIDALELEVGYDLFVRTPAKGIRTTPSGNETLQLIRGFIDQSKHFEGEVKSVGGDATGSVRVACYATAAPSFLPPILKNFKEEFPGVSITLLEGDMQTIMEYLDNGEADIAFTYDQTIESSHNFEVLFGAPVYALVSAEDPLADHNFVTMRQLSSLPMVLLDLPLTREYFISLFRGQKLKPNIVHSTRSTEIARALVSGGFGYTLLNICPPDYHKGRNQYVVVPISDDLPTPLFGIATQAATRQPKMVRAFVDQCVNLRDAGVFAPLVVS